MAISPQRLTIYLYSAHRAVIFAIAQLSCWTYDQVLFLELKVIKLGCLSEYNYVQITYTSKHRGVLLMNYKHAAAPHLATICIRACCVVAMYYFFSDLR